MQNSTKGAKKAQNAKDAKKAQNTNNTPVLVADDVLALNPAIHKGGIYKPEVFGQLEAKLSQGAITEKQFEMGKKSIRAKLRRQLDWAMNQWTEHEGMLPQEVLDKFLTWAYQIFITPTHLFDTNKSNINKYNRFQEYINANLPK